jgi:hypothetical protein
MPGFDGTGPVGMGRMTGGGRGFCSPRGMGAGMRTYGMPRWGGYGYTNDSNRQFGMPYPYRFSQEQELDFLKRQAEAMRTQLNQIDARIQELAKENK